MAIDTANENLMRKYMGLAPIGADGETATGMDSDDGYMAHACDAAPRKQQTLEQHLKQYHHGQMPKGDCSWLKQYKKDHPDWQKDAAKATKGESSVDTADKGKKGATPAPKKDADVEDDIRDAVKEAMGVDVRVNRFSNGISVGYRPSKEDWQKMKNNEKFKGSGLLAKALDEVAQKHHLVTDSTYDGNGVCTLFFKYGEGAKKPMPPKRKTAEKKPKVAFDGGNFKVYETTEPSKSAETKEQAEQFPFVLKRVGKDGKEEEVDRFRTAQMAIDHATKNGDDGAKSVLQMDDDEISALEGDIKKFIAKDIPDADVKVVKDEPEKGQFAVAVANVSDDKLNDALRTLPARKDWEFTDRYEGNAVQLKGDKEKRKYAFVSFKPKGGESGDVQKKLVKSIKDEYDVTWLSEKTGQSVEEFVKQFVDDAKADGFTVSEKSLDLLKQRIDGLKKAKEPTEADRVRAEFDADNAKGGHKFTKADVDRLIVELHKSHSGLEGQWSFYDVANALHQLSKGMKD